MNYIERGEHHDGGWYAAWETNLPGWTLDNWDKSSGSSP